MRSRQSEKERDTTRPLVQMMSLRNLHQGERCQPSPSTARMRVTPESEEVGVEVGQEGSLGDGGDDHDGEDGDGDGDEEDDIERNLMKGPQWVLKTTVPLFSLRNRPSTSFYLR